MAISLENMKIDETYQRNVWNIISRSVEHIPSLSYALRYGSQRYDRPIEREDIDVSSYSTLILELSCKVQRYELGGD